MRWKQLFQWAQKKETNLLHNCNRGSVLFYDLANPEVVRDIRLTNELDNKWEKVVVFLFSLSFSICLAYNFIPDLSSSGCLPGEYREDNQNGWRMKKRQVMEVKALCWVFCLVWTREGVKWRSASLMAKAGAGWWRVKSQAVRSVSHTHNYPVFFSSLSELQPVFASIKLPWFLLDLQDTKSQLSIEAGGYAARKADASAGSKSSILQTPAQVARKAKSFSNKAAAVHSAQKDPSSTLWSRWLHSECNWVWKMGFGPLFITLV